MKGKSHRKGVPAVNTAWGEIPHPNLPLWEKGYGSGIGKFQCGKGLIYYLMVVVEDRLTIPTYSPIG